MVTLYDISSGRKSGFHLLFSLLVMALLFAGGVFLNSAGFSLGELPLELSRYVYFLLCIYVGRWLCQRWYLKGRFLSFFLYALICCLLIPLTWWGIIHFLFGRQRADLFEVVVMAMPFFVIGVGLGILLKLFRTAVQKQVSNAQVLAEQQKSELLLLQSQLSPHFLFNTLNNLYGISIVHQERVPALLLKLSALLQYSVYDARQLFVPLSEELSYIKNYIEFEKIRISDRLKLDDDIAVEDESILIPPMILMVFVENAFKHAKNVLDKHIYVGISLRRSKEKIRFVVRNSFGEMEDSTEFRRGTSGLGQANTIKRLQLLYGRDYDLEIDSGNGIYEVRLQLKIK